MSGFTNSSTLRRVISLGTLTLFLAIGAYAQPEFRDKDVAKKKRSLEFKLIVLTPTACVGSPLKLRMEVTNTSHESIKLNRAYFWNTDAVFASDPEGKDEDKEQYFSHVWPVSTSEDIVILGPGKTYISHSYWSMNEDSGKLAPGNYTLQIDTYGTRNKGKFLIQDCTSEGLREY